MEVADAMVSSGLKDAGYQYVNMDGGWAIGRDPITDALLPDPHQFPDGVKAVADYVHSKGLLFGLYTDRGSNNCKGAHTGSDMHEEQDAEQFAEWGVDWIKDDSCGGLTHGSVWDARMRDAIIANKEVIALNQDALVSRAKLIHQCPDPVWPGWDHVPPNGTGYPVGSNGTAIASSQGYIHVGVYPPEGGFKPPNIRIQAWAKPLADGSSGVVIMNRYGSETGMTLIWSMLGMSENTTATVRDLWQHKGLGSFVGGVNVSVPPHDALALRITPTTDY